MAYFAALWTAKPEERPIESQNATRGQPHVTSTACAITKSVMNSEDHASTLFLENLLVKNPAGQIIST